MKRIKIRREFQSFGKEAYRQWKDGQYFSLKDKLNAIKAIEEEIHELSVILHRASEKFLELFCLKSLISKIRLNKLRKQTVEQPLHPYTLPPVVPDSQSPVKEEAVLSDKPLTEKKSDKSLLTPSETTDKPSKRHKEEKTPTQKAKSRSTAKSKVKRASIEKKEQSDIPS